MEACRECPIHLFIIGDVDIGINDEGMFGIGQRAKRCSNRIARFEDLSVVFELMGPGSWPKPEWVSDMVAKARARKPKPKRPQKPAPMV